MTNWQTVRIWKKVEWEKDNYKYTCQPDFEGSIDEFAGLETISKTGKEVYKFFYAGSLIEKNKLKFKPDYVNQKKTKQKL